jgi:hypothetical protein
VLFCSQFVLITLQATDDGDEADSKRICLPLRDLPVDSNNPPMPLAMRQLLDSVTPRGLAIKRETMITIPLESLESIREKVRLKMINVCNPSNIHFRLTSTNDLTCWLAKSK